MSYYLLSAETTFSAAHTLPGVTMCDRLHGHNWRVRLTVQLDCEDVDDTGMGVDFRIIEAITQNAVADFEHQYLNDLEHFRDKPPSAENIARKVCDAASAQLKREAPSGTVQQVEVWELPQYRVIYRP